MRILYISRNPKMGFSIGKVFKPVIEQMGALADVDSIELPCDNYNPKSLVRNIRYAQSAAKQKQYDIVHITGAEHYLLPFLKKYKTVVTVHDLGFFTNQKVTPRTLGKFLLWIYSLKCANYVTFISAKSEHECLKLVGLKSGRHSVVPDAVGKEFQYVPKKINTECPIILHIGTKPNKNLESTVIALQEFPCKLRIVGDLTDGQKYTLSLYKINYEQVSNLTDAEVLQEYVRCDYVNFPSLYEGFGMPIIEGQAVGRPVLTSNLPPMNDVAGGAAILVDPTNPNSIRSGYEHIGRQADSLMSAGLENVKRFGLKTITQQYFDIYNHVITHK